MRLRSSYSARRWLVLAALVGAFAAPVAAAAPVAGAPDEATPAAVSNDLPPEPAQPAPAEAAQDDRDLLELFGFRPNPPSSRNAEVMMFVVPAFSVNPAVGLALGVATAAVALGGSVEHDGLEPLRVRDAHDQGAVFRIAKSVLLTARNDWELLGTPASSRTPRRP